MHDIDRQLECMLTGDFKTGWEISEKLQAIGRDEIRGPDGEKNPEMWIRHNFNRGWFLLQQGKYQEGSQLLESGRFINVYGGGHLQTSAPLFNPQEDSLKGKSIILSLEGGYGDEIIHARFATSLKNKLGAKKVYIAAAPEIAGVFTRIEGVDGVIQRNQAHTVQHDYWLPGFSAGWVCGFDYDTIPNDPYISPIPSSVEIWNSFIQDKEGKKKVGIRWAGNPKFEHQQFRRFPSEFMINIAKYDGLDVYSFQRDHNLQELPENITDLQHLLISWEDTLAALSLMDIVITSCTSIAHAAAAMGKETWVFTPVLPYHIWAFGAPESKTSPYYKTAQVYRQKDNRNWNETFQEMYADLEKKFELEHIDLPNCDKVYKKANLGCGFEKLKGFDNYDISPVCRPDKILDLNVEKWDIPDDEYDHIVAKDVLEHVDDLIHVIKEMYRISSHGAVWEVQVPHWRCDNFIDDPTHKNAISARTFELFDMKKTLENLQRKLSHSYYAIEYNIDIEVCEVKYDFTDVWMRRFTESNASQAEIDYALNHMNNVAESIKILIQVHKGPRYNQADIEKVINEYCENF